MDSLVLVIMVMEIDEIELAESKNGAVGGALLNSDVDAAHGRIALSSTLIRIPRVISAIMQF
jgi:hypothetical protein